MKDTITPEMVHAVQKILKHASFDGQRYAVDIFEVEEITPCSLTQALFPEIIDLALEHLKRKASTSLLQFGEEAKRSNIEYVDHKLRLKNKVLPVFDWDLIK